MTDNNKKTHLVITGRGGGGSGEQVQADWSQTDSEQPDYIKNKPELATVATTGDYDDLQNKPTIPAAPVQSDWNESDTTSLAYINNKPAIPAAQVNSDWNANSGVAQILNKPTIPTVPAMATQELTFTLQGGSIKTVNFYTVPNYFYVKDISGADNTISIVKDNNGCPSIEVFKSTDGISWTSMGSTNTTAITATVPANGKLYLKATANKWGDDHGQGNKITCTGRYNAGGNIMSLLNSDNFEGTSFVNVTREFQSLFNGSTTLVNAKDIIFPNNLEYACYRSMFYGCTALVSVSAYSNNLGNQSFKDWLGNVAAQGDFYNLGGATFPTDSASGIPTGWTEHTSL